MLPSILTSLKEIEAKHSMSDARECYRHHRQNFAKKKGKKTHFATPQLVWRWLAWVFSRKQQQQKKNKKQKIRFQFSPIVVRYDFAWIHHIHATLKSEIGIRAQSSSLSRSSHSVQKLIFSRVLNVDIPFVRLLLLSLARSVHGFFV